MARSIYVMPIIGDGTKASPRRPKYRDSQMQGFAWAMFDYGDEPVGIVGIQDISPEADTALTDESDVFKLPDNLDQAVGSTGIRNTIRNRLEAVNIPGTWVQTTTTYRELVRFIGAVCQFAQRFQGISGIPEERWFGGGRTLASTFGSLPNRAQAGLIEAADSFGFDRSGLTASTVLRTFLRQAGLQYITEYEAGNLGLDLLGPL